MKISTKKINGSGPLDANILLVGESPGEIEEYQGQPFVGPAGDKLFEVLFTRYGIPRTQVRLENLCKYRPEGNKFEYLLGSTQLEESLNELHIHIQQYRPNIVICLGANPLLYLCDRTNINAHRGSFLPYIRDPKIKCFATFHPSNILHDPSNYILFDFDLKRAIDNSETPEFPYLKRNYYINPTSADLITWHNRIKSDPRKIVYTDIENIKDASDMICVGFAIDKYNSFCFPWTPEAIPFIRDICEDESITKVYHYGYMHDVEFLHTRGIEVKGKIHDTYIMAGIIDPGLPRSLDFLTSIHTFEPYYKTQGRHTLPGDTKSWGTRTNRSDVYIYNNKDCAVLAEIYEALDKEIDHEYYDYKLEQALMALDISREGMPIDLERRAILFKAATLKYQQLQFMLNVIVQPYIGKKLNVNSPKEVLITLHDKMGLPERKDYKTKKRSSKEEKLVSLIAFCQGKEDESKTVKTKTEWMLKKETVKLIIEIRGFRKSISSYINYDLSSDGRARSMANCMGTETSRWSASLYVDKSGFASQTLPRSDLPVPDNINELNLEDAMAQMRFDLLQEIKEDED